MSNELTFQALKEAISKIKSSCNHEELFEESTMGFSIDHTYIFRCKCGQTRLFKPPKEMIDQLKKDMELFHVNARKGGITRINGVDIITTGRGWQGS